MAFSDTSIWFFLSLFLSLSLIGKLGWLHYFYLSIWVVHIFWPPPYFSKHSFLTFNMRMGKKLPNFFAHSFVMVYFLVNVLPVPFFRPFQQHFLASERSRSTIGVVDLWRHNCRWCKEFVWKQSKILLSFKAWYRGSKGYENQNVWRHFWTARNEVFTKGTFDKKIKFV